MRNFAQLPFKVLTTRNVFLGNWGSPSKPLRPCLLFHIPDSHQSILSRFRGSDGWEILRWDGILISPWWKPQCCSRKLWLILALQGKSPVGADLLFFWQPPFQLIPCRHVSKLSKLGHPWSQKNGHSS